MMLRAGSETIYSLKQAVEYAGHGIAAANHQHFPYHAIHSYR